MFIAIIIAVAAFAYFIWLKSKNTENKQTGSKSNLGANTPIMGPQYQPYNPIINPNK